MVPAVAVLRSAPVRSRRSVFLLRSVPLRSRIPFSLQFSLGRSHPYAARTRAVALQVSQLPGAGETQFLLGRVTRRAGTCGSPPFSKRLSFRSVAVDWLRRLPVVAIRGWIVDRRPNARLPGMGGNGDQDLADVVVVAQLRELVTEGR